MSGFDVVSQPLLLLDSLFRERVAHSGSSLPTDDCGFVHRVRMELSNEATLARIPWLTKAALQTVTIPPNSLVRYRCMIQDMYDPELFDMFYEQVDLASGTRAACVAPAPALTLCLCRRLPTRHCAFLRDCAFHGRHGG